jgi:hypothetical protein
MLSSQDFMQRLKSHVGGIVRIVNVESVSPSRNDVIFLLVSANWDPELGTDETGQAEIRVMANGKIDTIYIYEREIELIGGCSAE